MLRLKTCIGIDARFTNLKNPVLACHYVLPILPRKREDVNCTSSGRRAAMGALKFLTAMGLFIGQSPQFFAFLRDLAEDADEARRGGQ